jgi:hypothetical protein
MEIGVHVCVWGVGRDIQYAFKSLCMCVGCA